MPNIQNGRLRYIVQLVSRKARKASKSTKQATEKLESMFSWGRDAWFSISASQNLTVTLTVLLGENGDNPVF